MAGRLAETAWRAIAGAVNELEVRQAMQLTIDRKSFLDIIAEEEGGINGAMQSPPADLWGLPPEMLVTLPGYGPDVAANRGEARKLMAKHGYTGRTTDEIRACNQHRWSARPNHPTNDPRPRRRGHRVNRRAIVALALGLCVWSLSADAQQPTKIPLVGILSGETSIVGAKSFEPFAQGLQALGHIEGQNTAFERRYANHKYELLPSLATELVRLRPDVILTVGTPAARAAKSVTQTIPVVFARIGDPVGMGLVPALARPGGNFTGVSILTKETGAKRLELLIAAAPGAKRAGVLWNPSNRADTSETKELEAAVRILNLVLVPAEVRSPDDFEPALRAIVEHGAAVVVVVGSVIFLEHWQRLAGLMAKTRLPAMFNRREFVEAGGLMSFGTNFPDMYRRAAAYVDKILKGAMAADLPVEQPTKFELVINLKTATELGLTLPYTLLALADEVIE